MDRTYPNLSPRDEIAVAQVSAYVRRVPILYLVIILNTVILAYTHFGQVPPLYSLYAPGTIIAAIIIRLAYWLRLKTRPIQPHQTKRIVRATIVSGATIAICILSWSLSLMRFKVMSGQGYLTSHGQIAIFVTATVICAISLLMHVRAAATCITAIIIPPFCLFLISSGQVVEISTAIDIALVSLAMLYVIHSFGRDFRGLIVSKIRLRRSNARNARLAYLDQVTGLPNRRRFFAHLSVMAMDTSGYAIAVLDMDGFKQINDLYGHQVGDSVLAEIGRRLSSAAPEGALVSRLGGDEFAIVVAGIDEAAALHICQTLIATTNHPVTINHITVNTTLSVGVSVAHDPEAGPVEHYERADYALRHAKRSGRGYVELFSPAHKATIDETNQIERALRDAVLGKEIQVAYQPILRAGDHALVAYEALARWQSPQLGAVSPAMFIPIAERAGLIDAITRTVLRKALREAESWPPHVNLKVNLSIQDLISPVQVLALKTIVRHAKIHPARLTLEITETLLAENFCMVQEAITDLKTCGLSIAIDDFGVGYSSLNYIHHLAPDVIKIDRTFIEKLGEDPVSTSIVKTILELCANIGASSIAEGIETAEQAALLADLGCNELQGFFLGRPLSSRQLKRRHRPLPVTPARARDTLTGADIRAEG